MSAKKEIFKVQSEKSINLPPKRGIGLATGLAALFLFLFVLGMTWYSNPTRADFFVCYSAGFILRHGSGTKLYNLNEQEKVQERLFHRKEWLMYPDPPFQALLFVPLTYLDYSDAYKAWGALNVLLWLFFMYLLLNQTGASCRPFRSLHLASLFFPLWFTLMEGQLSIILLVSYGLTYVYLKRNRDFLSGAFLGLGLVKYQAVLFFALICLLLRKWRFMLGFLSVACLLGLVSYAAIGSAGMGSYIGLIATMLAHHPGSAYPPITAGGMPTIGGFLSETLRSKIPEVWIRVVASCFSICLIMFAAWRWKKSRPRQSPGTFDLIFASSLTVSLISTPFLLLYDLTPMILAVTLVVNSPQWARYARERTALIVATGMLYAIPFGFLLVHRKAPFVLAPVLLLFALAALALAKDKTHQESVPDRAPRYSES